MKHLIFAAVVGLGLGPFASADVTRYERVATRQLLLDLAQNPPQTPVKLVGRPSPRAEVRHFLDYYLTIIAPKLDHVRDLTLRQTVYEMLIMTNSQDSPAELAEWKALMAKYDEQLTDHATDRAYTDQLREAARMSVGLRGNLPKRVRRLLNARVMEEFDPSTKPMLDELDRVMTTFKSAQQTAPANRGIKAFSARAQATELAFKLGRIDVHAALNELKRLHLDQGPHVLGYQAVERAGDALNRAAVLRSQLAKSKGEPTWAAYRLNQNGAGYDAAYRGPANQIRFLTQLLDGLKAPFNKFMDARIDALGLRGVDIPEYALELLKLPTFEAVAAHFPGSEITNMWQQTMYESGFDEATLRQNLVDDGLREGKSANIAFMNSIVDPEPHEVVINQTSLHVQIPGRNELRPGLVLTYQTSGDEGVPDLETSVHEGGHTLDFLLRGQSDRTLPQAYGTIEVPSMTFERFVRDPEVLYARAVSIDGREPSLTDLKRMVANADQNRLVELVRWTSQSLFDIAIWNYDYAAPGAQTYLERLDEISKRYDVTLNRLPPGDLPVHRRYRWLSTRHFTSGNVRYSGYVFAELGSRMVRDYISEQLEDRTGRRGWYQQPAFADIFVNDVVRNLWRTKFPTNVETITGAKFSTAEVIADFTKMVGCEGNLAY